jgi:hypothetical protein
VGKNENGDETTSTSVVGNMETHGPRPYLDDAIAKVEFEIKKKFICANVFKSKTSTRGRETTEIFFKHEQRYGRSRIARTLLAAYLPNRRKETISLYAPARAAWCTCGPECHACTQICHNVQKLAVQAAGCSWPLLSTPACEKILMRRREILFGAVGIRPTALRPHSPQ